MVKYMSLDLAAAERLALQCQLISWQNTDS
jgi:hypothetical protein